jgi:secreted Zn-dependent insulinase-like peptidase
MTVAISGNYSLEDLEKLAKAKFDPVINKHMKLPELHIPNPYLPKHSKKLIKFKPNMDKDVLSIYWALDDYYELQHES